MIARLHAPLIDRLHQLGLTAMADAWRQQQHQPEIVALAFDDRLSLLLDAEWAARQQRQLSRRLREAPWRFPATPEDVDYHAPRQWNTGLIRQ